MKKLVIDVDSLSTMKRYCEDMIVLDFDNVALLDYLIQLKREIDSIGLQNNIKIEPKQFWTKI